MVSFCITKPQLLSLCHGGRRPGRELPHPHGLNDEQEHVLVEEAMNDALVVEEAINDATPYNSRKVTFTG